MGRSMYFLFSLFFMFMVSVTQAGVWEPLFNGKNLDGWKTIGDQSWSVKDGRIVVKATGDEMGWLVHESPYENFVLSLRYKWHGGNSGIQFRSQLEGEKMIGYQANLDPGRNTATGSLVDENGRGLLKETKRTADEIFQKDEWNTYEITAIGDRIWICLNGQPALELSDPEGANKGIIALQMGPAENAGLEFDNIRVLPLPDNTEWMSLFDGESLEGWKAIGDSEWEVEEGAIHGTYKNLGYGWLISEEEYSDFHFVCEFKMPSGNSGIQFRSERVGGMVHGYQADLADESDWITGHLYDQNRDGVTKKPDYDVLSEIELDEWNTYEITAVGPTVELFINGKKTVEHTDPDKPRKGIFAFQIHSGKKMETFWRNIRVLPLR